MDAEPVDSKTVYWYGLNETLPGFPSMIPHDAPSVEAQLLAILQERPHDLDALLRLTRLLQETDRHRDVLPFYREALRRNPTSADLRFHHANTLADLGELDLAIAEYGQASVLDPRHIEALTNRGIAHARRGDLPGAIHQFHRALQLRPDFAGAHHNLGVALAQQGRPAEAITSFQRALQLKPDYAEAAYNLGNVLRDQGRRHDAIEAFHRAVVACPDHADACNNLGLALTDVGRAAEAVVYLRHAARLRPSTPLAHNNLGLALTDLGRFGEAESCFHEALRLDPRYADAMGNLANAYKDAGDLAAAQAAYDLAIALDPQCISHHWNRSLAWLQAGDYARGWAEYEWRWRRPSSSDRPLKRPTWDGGPLSGQTILLSCEQGLGDAIQFVRYAPLVQQRGGRVVLECPGLLAALFERVAGLNRVVIEGQPLPPFAVQAPLLSLPHLLGTTLDSVPAMVPYLSADPALVDTWRSRLEAQKGFKVGICWQGNPYHKWDRYRSVPLEHFGVLAAVPAVRLVALQREFGREQIVRRRQQFPLSDHGDILGEPPACWLDTASLLANLDLVVTVDTAVAHLAGALGKPVWIALSASFVDWRWLRDRDDSPWYPTARLFRQEKLGDWRPVFQRIARELEGVASSASC